MAVMQRTIKSFVLRAGRISNRQQYALQHKLKDYELALDDQPWDLDRVFARHADTVIEVGFGMGKSLLTMAQQHPELNFIGIEVHRAGIGSLVADLQDKAINNVRLITSDAVEVFKRHLPKNSLRGVQIFFPDPWHKKRHHKRRLIQPPFIESLTQCLKIGGFIHCATDWQPYAEHMRLVFSAQSNLLEQLANNSRNRPLTKFEQRGIQLGHDIWDLFYLKLA